MQTRSDTACKELVNIDKLIVWGLKKTEPQIKAPRVTPLEGVSTYALRGIGVRGVENPQGFGIDERGFVALNLSHLIGAWDFMVLVILF